MATIESAAWAVDPRPCSPSILAASENAPSGRAPAQNSRLDPFAQYDANA